MVANAAPFTPNLNTKIKIGSKMIFDPAPMNIEIMATLAFPSALIKLLVDMAKERKTLP